jgi:hypothetical protein
VSRSLRRCISSLLVTACAAGALHAQSSTLRYTEVRGARRTPVEYRLLRGADAVTLTATAPDSVETILWQVGTESAFGRAGTVDWRRVASSEGSELHAVRTADVIHISGTLKGRAVSRDVKVDAAPWYQLFGPLMDQLLPAGASAREFWVLDPADLSAHKMQVKRAGLERITVHGVAMEAVKIHFSPAGALAPFWGADFWYRPGDLSYLSSRLPENGGVTVATVEDLPP